MIAKTAIIEGNVQIGEGMMIWHWVHIMPGARIGENCTIGERVFIGENVKIGDDCKIQTGAFIPEGVTLGDRVFVGPNVTFTNVKRPCTDHRGIFEQTLVDDLVTIGANATIICGNRLCMDAIVAAGAVVTKEVLPGTTVKGVPARCE